jgi:8-oxo-dGTP diphosphatase
MPYKPITGTLGYILTPDKKKVLLVHRNARVNDEQLGKYNGLGGKMEKNESVSDCMRREIEEEAGIKILEYKLRGTINWTNFGKNGEDWLGFIFLITKYSGTPYTKNEEGDLFWIPLEEIYNYPMWEGDKHYLPLLFDNDPRIFHGYMPYKSGKPLSWSFERI